MVSLSADLHVPEVGHLLSLSTGKVHQSFLLGTFMTKVQHV